MTTIPTTTLNNGVEMPVLGYGVFQTPLQQTATHVREALEVGYRLIDTAQAYGNEEGVGQGVRDSGVAREDVFITSKIWVSNMSYERARASIDESLRLLGTDYLDLMLLHQAWGDYPGAWRALEEAYADGRLRAIGVSNFYLERVIDVALLAEVPPAVNQIETHPFRQQDEAHRVLSDLGIAHEAWAPFAEGQNNIFANPVLTEIGARHGKTAGQVILRALMDKDVIVIPKTVRRERMEENLDVFDFELTDADKAAFAALDDPSFPRIFDHYDPTTVRWLLGELVKKQQLGGAALY
ncbi:MULTISPECIES: aldo/keto reductase [unclassified Actinomyces]|uniref:aldo/keto reductase n=1 Tax=unclassified Actinomyces TaxID=2609248 RepID=UPI0020181FC6|nr:MULTISPECIES: aldo/keto reductase [unclassified Actinomyces]MCL3777635.1 aldo/keto reductase [Actinomyces sp. AC-20-1]MCL3790018.1 aldo/keto reductase [Actinomyces sp. 187325]MCL3792415.1 aldo/keto reductase [Actinomyces sp. 186855]MCL3794840.1 aldo/keto reductase [Actinomyces sp. 217892]